MLSLRDFTLVRFPSHRKPVDLNHNLRLKTAVLTLHQIPYGTYLSATLA